MRATRAAPSVFAVPPSGKRPEGYAEGATLFDAPGSASAAPASKAGAAPGKGADKQDKAASPKGTPISLAAARAEAARKLPVDRSKYQTIRNAC